MEEEKQRHKRRANKTGINIEKDHNETGEETEAASEEGTSSSHVVFP